ncbi:hypothetical protein IPL85_03600 [Candidatus Saccharibacteria bacterium]|nr:MAG: hypothetical protein IPL85_03600 [Candidatus Saccharibacteria bacterium]
MAFNHYAKLKRILANEPADWFIRRIDEPTTAQTFKGELRRFDYYYRLYHADGTPIKYGKFQQLDRLASTLGTSPNALPIVND